MFFIFEFPSSWQLRHGAVVLRRTSSSIPEVLFTFIIFNIPHSCIYLLFFEEQVLLVPKSSSLLSYSIYFIHVYVYIFTIFPIICTGTLTPSERHSVNDFWCRSHNRTLFNSIQNPFHVICRILQQGQYREIQQGHYRGSPEYVLS